jgi:hypothetical protein
VGHRDAAANARAAKFLALEDRLDNALVVFLLNLARFEQRGGHRSNDGLLFFGLQVGADRLAANKIGKLHRSSRLVEPSTGRL